MSPPKTQSAPITIITNFPNQPNNRPLPRPPRRLASPTANNRTIPDIIRTGTDRNQPPFPAPSARSHPDAASFLFPPDRQTLPRAQTNSTLYAHNCPFFSVSSFCVLSSLVLLSNRLHRHILLQPSSSFFSLFHLLLSFCLLVATPAV